MLNEAYTCPGIARQGKCTLFAASSGHLRRTPVRCAFSGVQVNLPYFEVDIFSFARIITVFFGRKSWLLALVH